MRKVLLALVFLCFLSTIHAQWTAMPTLNGPTLSSLNMSYPGVGTDVLLAGTFTATSAGVSSPLCIVYNAASNTYTPITGFNSSTDQIVGFFLGVDGFIRVYGKFKSGVEYYGIYTFDGISSFAPDMNFKFTGPNASNQKIDAAYCSGGTTMVYGVLLTELNGVTLSTGHSVATITGTGSTTNQSSLVPSISGETPSIKNIRHDGSQWLILGNFDQLGTTTCSDLARWNETIITPVNMTTIANTYSKDYEGGVVGWTGTTTLGGVTSPGGIGLSGNSLYGLGSGWLTITQDVQTFNGESWICGSLLGSAGPSNRSRIASYGSTWTNREGNLTTNNTSLSLTIYGMCVAVDGSGNPVMVAYGNLIQGVNSQFSYMARWVSTALPVELTSFKVKSEKNGNLLIWETATEKLNKGFYVEKSLDGFNFIEIGFVDSKSTNGNSSAYLEYNFFDNANTEKPIVYYRLKQIDISGEVTYSSIVPVTKNLDYVQVYPNPVTDQIVLSISDESEAQEIIIVDITGRVLYQKEINNSKHYIDVSEWQHGTYFIISSKWARRVIKK